MLTAVLTVAWAVLVTGCTDPTASRDRLLPVQNLAAWSDGPSSIGLDWDHSPTARSFDAAAYRVDVRWEGTLVSMRRVPLTQTRTVIDSLVAGRLYACDVIVESVPSPADFASSPAVTILWSPALRFTAVGDSAIDLPPPGMSGTVGLRLFDSVAAGPVYKDAATAEIGEIDLYYSGAGSVLLAGDRVPGNPQGRQSRFSVTLPVIGDSWEQPIGFAPDVASYSLDEFRIPPEPLGGDMLFFVRLHEGNVARVLVRRGGDGSLVRGPASSRFIRLEVSYQPNPLIGVARPYAH